jgi:hypothetical protein
MFATLIVFAFAYSCLGDKAFVQDVIFNILETVSEGVENSRKIGRYQMFIQWQDKKSRVAECNCRQEDTRQYTDDVTKWGPDVFVFPTSTNANIPDFELNKERILVHILKELVDMYSGMNIELNGDSCCHLFSIQW